MPKQRHRLHADDFLARVNSDLVGKYINIASRARLHAKRFGGKLGEVSADGAALLEPARARRTPSPGITKPANTPRPARNHG
jgi:methionyl-tRNA synthetase